MCVLPFKVLLSMSSQASFQLSQTQTLDDTTFDIRWYRNRQPPWIVQYILWKTSDAFQRSLFSKIRLHPPNHLVKPPKSTAQEYKNLGNQVCERRKEEEKKKKNGQTKRHVQPVPIWPDIDSQNQFLQFFLCFCLDYVFLFSFKPFKARQRSCRK